MKFSSGAPIVAFSSIYDTKAKIVSNTKERPKEPQNIDSRVIRLRKVLKFESWASRPSATIHQPLFCVRPQLQILSFAVSKFVKHIYSLVLLSMNKMLIIFTFMIFKLNILSVCFLSSRLLITIISLFRKSNNNTPSLLRYCGFDYSV